jgi:hypothetical protein
MEKKKEAQHSECSVERSSPATAKNFISLLKMVRDTYLKKAVKKLFSI